MVKKVAFDDLQRGDKLSVETSTGSFQITITGKRKNGSILLVTVINKTGEEQEKFTARMPGGFIKGTVEDGLTRLTRYIKVATEQECNTLLFQNLKDLTGERMAATMRTTPIQTIKLQLK